VPYVIAMRVIELSDPSLQQAQGVWLNDNGYPKTGEAVFQFARGEISAIDLRKVAMAEFASATPKPTHGTTAVDEYGVYLLTQEDNDALYSYALTSTSIPLVTQAATKLASIGDTRAAQLTQHLADLTV
jgi:hypothetical protein